MKYTKFILPIFLIFIFNACATKVQEDIAKSNSNDVSQLLQKLIEKEKEINRLNNELEKYKTMDCS